MKNFLSIGNKKFKSRLFMGTSKYPNHQIMLESLSAAKTEVVTALQAGVNNYIVKPFTAEVLKEKIAGVM